MFFSSPQLGHAVKANCMKFWFLRKGSTASFPHFAYYEFSRKMFIVLKSSTQIVGN